MDLQGVYVEDQKHDTLMYAGTMEVRITDWFFFKDKADLKYIGLSDAVINFNRTDSTWNYHFLEDYFSTPTKPQKKKSAGIQFNLKKINLNNVAFFQHDAWLGNDLTVKVAGLDLDMQDLSISRRNVMVSNVELTSPYFSIYDYKGKFIDTTNTPGADWTIAINNAKITNGRFRLNNGSMTPEVSYFDTHHLDFSGLTGVVKNLNINGDVIKAGVNLRGKERSGLQIRSLVTNFTMQPKGMTFDKLFLQTNRSTIRNFFAMKYPSAASLDDFEHAVRMEARFNNSTISSDDIAFFTPDARSWKKNIKIDGLVTGTVDALRSEDLELWAGKDTHLQGKVRIVGLPNINKTYFNIQANDLRTTYADLVAFVPDLRKIETPNLRKLSFINFKGTYTGFFDDFVTDGTINTKLGSIRADLNMKFPKKGDPTYSGTLSTNGFQVGEFVNDNKLGIVDFHGKVKGHGFDWKTMNITIDGIVHKIRYDNYTYQNLTAKGTFNKRRFNGNFSIKDPNADLSLTGIIDLSGKTPLFNAKATVAYANLKPLQLTKDDIVLKGNFDLDIQGSNLSNLLGTARISNATVLHEGTRLSFDSLYVSSTYEEGIKTLRAISNELDATIAGTFDLASLPDAFSLFLSRYYPSYIKVPRNVKPQNFTFNIRTGNVEDYLKLIDKNLTGFNNSELQGSLNTTANTMTINADVPHVGYKQYDLSDVRITGSGDFQKLNLSGQVTNAVIDSNFVLPASTFTITAQNDVSDFNIETSSNQPITAANLSGQVKTFRDGFTLLVNPSSFVLNGKTWNIEQGGELNFRKNTIVHGQLVLREAQQEIIVQSIPSSIGSWNDLHVSLHNLNLNDLSPIFLPKNRLEGTVSGEIVVEDPERKFYVTGAIQGQGIKLDNDSIGNITATLIYNKQTGLLTAKAFNLDPVHKIGVDIAMNLTPGQGQNNRISLILDNFQISYLERFIGTLFSNLHGYATGNVDIVSHGNHDDFLAKVKVRDAGFKVVFTQVAYTIDDTEIELKQDQIDLNGIKIRDSRGNVANVNGRIRHQGFSNMDYDIAVKTASPDMELLNTTYKDNQIFYGRAYGAGSFVLVGPDYDMNMFVEVTASNRDSSSLTLPPTPERESGQAQFMVEKKYGVEMNPVDLRGGATNITYNVRMTATPMLNLEVILDDLTGDMIRGRGTGTLEIASGTSAPLTLNGTFNIEEGNYLYTFQSVFKRPFVLRKGANNYISWNRDPYDAQVNIEAVYTAEKVSFAPLAASLSLKSSNQTVLSQIRDNVNVVAHMTGKLFQPNFTFNLEFPPNSPATSNPDIAFGIQQLEKDPNELLKNVTYLIVANSFAPYQAGQGALATPFEELTYSTISGLVFNVINQQLNQIFSRIFRNNKNFTFNFSGSLYNKNLINTQGGFRLFNQVASNVSIGTSLLNERVIFTVGGTFDVPLENTGNTALQTFQLLPDVTLEVLLNATGSLRATFFYRQNIDYFYGSTTSGSPTTKRFGSSLSYNKEFDSLGEWLFGKKPKKDTARVLSAESAPSGQ